MLKPGSFVVFRLKKRNGHCVCLCGKFDGLLVVSLRLSICFEYFFLLGTLFSSSNSGFVNF